MITIANPEKYRAVLYERLSNENIEVASGEVVVSKDDELVLLDKEPINGFYHIITKTGIEGYCMVEFVELV